MPCGTDGESSATYPRVASVPAALAEDLDPEERQQQKGGKKNEAK